MHCGSGQSFRGYLVVTSYHRGAGTGGGGGHHADTLGWLGVVRGLVSGLQKAGQYNTWRDKTPLHCIYSINPNPCKSQAINSRDLLSGLYVFVFICFLNIYISYCNKSAKYLKFFLYTCTESINMITFLSSSFSKKHVKTGRGNNVLAQFFCYMVFLTACLLMTTI